MTRKRYSKKRFSVVIALVIGIITFAYSQAKSIIPLSSNSDVSLAKCVDGDTARLHIEGKETIVRFLAIDTPETVKPGTEVQPFGKEASNYTCDALTNAKEIKLEFEDGNEKDKYDRTLAWVWVDGVLLQQSLVAEGFAEVKYLYGDYKYTEQIQAVQTQAKSDKKGIWSY